MTHAYRMAAIREREAAAQRGDWFCDGYDIWHCGESYESKTDPHFYTGVSLDPNLTKSSKALANLDFCAQARSDIPYLLERVEALEAALGEATNTLMYISDKAVVDWDGATVGEAAPAIAKLPETYKENYINFMRVATKIWPLVIVGADMELNTITLLCEAGGVKMGETLGALFYRRQAIKEGRDDDA